MREVFGQSGGGSRTSADTLHFEYTGTNWRLSSSDGATVEQYMDATRLSDYGLNITGTPASGATITVSMSREATVTLNTGSGCLNISSGGA